MKKYSDWIFEILSIAVVMFFIYGVYHRFWLPESWFLP